MRNTKKGFTLVELLVVIAILAILATVSVVGYTSFIDRANQSTAQQELVQLRDYAIAVDMTSGVGDLNGVVDADEAAVAISETGVADKAVVGNNGTVVKYTVNGASAYWTLTNGKVETASEYTGTFTADETTPDEGGEEGGETPVEPEPETPAEPVLAATISFSDKANRTEYSSSKQVWVQNGITLTNNKSSSTTNVGDYADPVRFYKGSEVIIEYVGMKKIVIESAADSGTKDLYFTRLVNDITNAVGDSGTVTNEGTKITIAFNSACDSFTFNSSEGQTRVYSIEVYN